MRLTSAMLADAAQVTAGKLYVLGGAFDTITARSFPVVYRSLAVVLVAEVGPADRNRDLGLRIALFDEDGNHMGVESQGNLRVGAPASIPPGAATVVPLVGAFGNVRFPNPGGYVFVVDHDGEELARIPFRLRSTP
ncbi:MAG: hypothetical protein QY307_01070 [Acidimicrobiia bacterium]|nr:MAG: hypothetical protein QY307_01070 [Acidimicrobiia bacterium]